MLKITKNSKADGIRILSRNAVKYLHELELLQGENVEILSYGKNFCCISTDNPAQIYFMFVFDKEFDCTFFDQVMKNYDDAHSLLVSVQCKDECISYMCSRGFRFTSKYKNYIYDKESQGKCNEKVIRLTKDHKSDVDKVSFPKTSGRPPFSMLFDVLVIGKEGGILAYVENDILLGYLSYVNSVDNVLDVDYIYVDEPYRRKKIGRTLASSYASWAVSQGMIPYWGTAISRESEKTAESAGFVCCCEHFHFEKQ